jgi:hypothetical protein
MQDQTLELVWFFFLCFLAVQSCSMTVAFHELVRLLEYRLVVLVWVGKSLHLGHQGETESSDAGYQDIVGFFDDFFFRETVRSLIDGCCIRGLWTEFSASLESEAVGGGAFVPCGVEERSPELAVLVQTVIPSQFLPVCGIGLSQSGAYQFLASLTSEV